jgi:hypothetical protein
MQDDPETEATESVETVKDSSAETQPASDEDVERAREHEDLLASSPGTTKDRSLTGESRPVDFDEVEGPNIAED